MSTKEELKKVFEGLKNWKLAGDDDHLQAQYVGNDNIFVEFNSHILTFQFAQGESVVSLRVPYTEIEIEEGVLHIPSIEEFFPVMNL